MHPQLPWQQSGQRGEQRSIRPRVPWPDHLPSQYRDLVPQYQQLGSHRRLAASKEDQPSEQAHHDQIKQPQTHDRPSCLIATSLQSRSSSDNRDVLERYTGRRTSSGGSNAQCNSAATTPSRSNSTFNSNTKA
jgi:hypothetical protein